jgi:hypothetical protein
MNRKNSNLKLAAPANFKPDTNPLTLDEVERIAESLAWTLAGGPDSDLALFLLLCRAFTYEEDRTEREHMLCAVEAKAGVLLPGFTRNLCAAAGEALDDLRKGGAA